MHKQFFVYILIVFISFTTNKMYDNCNHPSIKVDIVNLIHHFVSIYSWFGTLILGHPEIHLLYVLTIIAGWKYFGNCIISDWYNNACQLDKSKNHRDLPYYFMSYITNEEYQSYDYLIYVVVLLDIALIAHKYLY